MATAKSKAVAPRRSAKPAKAAPRPGGAPASTRTLYLLSRAHYAVRGRIDQVLSSAGLTGVQYTILSLLKGRAQLSSADIARHYHVKPQSMNEVIFALERRDLICRTPDPRNRRTLRITLTETGAATLQACDAMVQALEADLFAGIEADELERFRVTLKRMLNALSPDTDEAG